MFHLSPAENQILGVTNFKDLVSTPFYGEMNAICRTRELMGDFSEIVEKIKLNENIATAEQEELREIELSEPRQFAREIILKN